uniref:ATP synthase F0 subunit 8 n=1 Tax=Pheidole tristis TaxID=615606 RepID=A0A343YVP4_9HYME|nr:ATP synthase F0 subunit 8 [Pheidole tristis]
MPQMMPMFWTIMMILTMTMLFMTIILMYFFYLPKLNHNKYSPIQYPQWKWMW